MPFESNPAFRLVDTVTATAMQVGSMVRSARIFHPVGVAHRITITIRPTDDETGTPPLGVPLLDEPGTYAGVARFSRGVSLPEPVPDILGVALRILDAHGPGQHQDVLVNSALSVPVGRQLFVPSFSFAAATLSSVLPYRLGTAGTFLLGGQVLDRNGAALVRLADLQNAVEAGELTLRLRYASRFGPWRTFADVEVGEALSPQEAEDLRFNVDDNTGGGIEPAGFFQALRRHAYTASQAGRAA